MNKKLVIKALKKILAENSEKIVSKEDIRKWYHDYLCDVGICNKNYAPEDYMSEDKKEYEEGFKEYIETLIEDGQLEKKGDFFIDHN